MTTPTREQVIEWAKASGFDLFDMKESLREAIDKAQRFAAAARAQALDEAALICDTTPPEPFRPSIEAAHAIRQLKAKP